MKALVPTKPDRTGAFPVVLCRNRTLRPVRVLTAFRERDEATGFAAVWNSRFYREPAPAAAPRQLTVFDPVENTRRVQNAPKGGFTVTVPAPEPEPVPDLVAYDVSRQLSIWEV
jgi:hypothetical protein